MEVILKETIDTLGEEGDKVKVKNGYGRNYLIPRGKAMIATKSNLVILEQGMAAINARKEKQKKETETLEQKITGAVLTIAQRVGEENKLFGSVTTADIANRLKELSIDVDRKKIVLDEPIKTLGETLVRIKIGFQTTAELKVRIVPLLNE